MCDNVVKKNFVENFPWFFTNKKGTDLNRHSWLFSDITNYHSWSFNFGPQHPAAHGVLRLILEVKGERVIGADPHIGLLHRGTEKLMESRTFLQNLPYLDRLDYVSMMCQEHTYTTAVENLVKLEIPLRAQFIRVIYLELTRILNHLMAITTHALDLGALTPFLWAFEEREKIFEFYERVSGARMHAAYIRPGGVNLDLSNGLIEDIFKFAETFLYRIDELDELLTWNRIWRKRLKLVADVSTFQAIEMGWTGVPLRSTGVAWDIRKVRPYETYSKLKFRVPLGYFGDGYDRYLLRLSELRQSTLIIKECIKLLPYGLVNYPGKFTRPSRSAIRVSMESLIQHFKMYSEGVYVNEGSDYSVTEAPKGDFGVFIEVSNLFSNFKPYRCKFRSPSFYHLQTLDMMSYGNYISDLVAIIGTLDIVFGEIDR